MRPRIDGAFRVKFKAEALPLKDEVGGYRILYSHNTQFGLSQFYGGSRTAMATLALARLGDTADQVTLVNEGIVEEVLRPLGALDFGKGLRARCDIDLSRTRGEHQPLVSEFAFQAKFDDKENVAARQKQRAAGFYLALQHAVKSWLALGVTKTAMVYRLNGAEPQRHE